MDWGKKCLIDFNAGKIQLLLFDWCNNNVSIGVMGLFLRKNHLLRCWGWLWLKIGLGLLHYLYY